MLLPVFLTAITAGLGCGTCGSPVVSLFLSAYVVSHADGIKRGLLSFISFFLGKLMSVSILCAAVAAAGIPLVDQNGCIGNFSMRMVMRISMSMIGIILSIKWAIRYVNPGRKCGACSGCGQATGEPGFFPMFFGGMAYGLTPCVPLLVMLGQSATLPVGLAAAMGMVFCLSSMISPILIVAMITGALSKRLALEIPNQAKWFKLASYVLLVIMPFVLE